MNYGRTIPNLKIEGKEAPYAVVNEREIRAAAGIMLLVGAMTFSIVYFTKDYFLLYVVVPLFWLEFFLKTVFQPHYSIFAWLGSFLVKNQTPEYVGAIQKRFAWGMGLFMATLMMIVAIGAGIRGALPIAICSTCLFFMWMESALGICVGCKIYSTLIRKGWIKKPDVQPVCPGGVCSINKPKSL